MPRKRPPPRTLRVLSKQTITEHMLRVTLGGDGLDGFPADQDGAYVKLHVPSLETPGETVVRTYTIRFYREDAGEIDIDFVLHDTDGPAAQWAVNCESGDEILVGGPGPKKTAKHAADWFLFAGDMSALPAISANLEALPAGSSGIAIIEVISDDDRQHIDKPDGLHIEWLVNPEPERDNSYLLDAVKAAAVGQGQPYYWVAGEFNQSLAIRKFLREQREATRDWMYASSYWQIGKTEDGHRVSKAAAGD